MNYRETPCEHCGWKFPGDHVCIDLSTPVDPKLQKKHNTNYLRSETHRAHLNQGRDNRWAQHREDMAERDGEIVERYKKGDVSIKQLARDFGIAFQTARNVLHRAAANNEVVMRSPGININYPRKGGV